MTTTTELGGKVALVTGASRNIGRAIALALAAGGAAVAVNARSAREDANKVAQEIRGAGGQAEAFMADIVDAKAVNGMVDGILKRFGRLDILVLNASVRKETPFVDMSFDEWKSFTAVTLDGSFHCVKACLPHLIKAGGGAIVTLGGMTALSGAKRRVHGSVGKFGLYGMTRALALDLLVALGRHLGVPAHAREFDTLGLLSPPRVELRTDHAPQQPEHARRERGGY